MTYPTSQWFDFRSGLASDLDIGMAHPWSRDTLKKATKSRGMRQQRQKEGKQHTTRLIFNTLAIGEESPSD